jgi:uncharacterized membrane protein YdcZ (DUF606 family)
MNNPKVTLFLGYVVLGCGLLISLIRIAEMLGLFGLSKPDGFFKTFTGFIFVVLGVLIIRKFKKQQ